MASNASTVTLAGKKRKRQDVEVDVAGKLARKLHHYQKEVRKIAKKVKAFEIQRIVKRKKELREPTEKQKTKASKPDPQNLEQELEFLKTIDLEHIAYRALISKIRKDKVLSGHDSVISALQTLPFVPSSLTGTQQKVEARLLSSKLLATEVNSAIGHLRGVIDPTLRPKTRDTEEVQSRREDTGDHDEEGRATVSGDELEMPSDIRPNSTGYVLDEADDSVDDAGWESGSMDVFESGEDDGGKESEDENEVDIKDGGDEESGSDIPPKRPKFSNNNEKRTPAVTTTSTFLPSLSTGFIRGDSDSEFESDSEGEGVKSSRKNRRGQRARQAIWEKKYGKNAKHVKKRQEKMQAATMAKKLGKRQDKGWAGKGADMSNNKVAVEKPIHPSWEARKRLKEKEGQILPVQGKKIVFT